MNFSPVSDTYTTILHQNLQFFSSQKNTSEQFKKPNQKAETRLHGFAVKTPVPEMLWFPFDHVTPIIPIGWPEAHVVEIS